MDLTKTIKIILNVIYFIGVIIVLCLGAIGLFGSNSAIYSTAMIPMTWKEQAFVSLAFGAVPMLLACMAVYKFNAFKNSVRKKTIFILIFLPGFICSACALFAIGVVIAGMINTFVFHGELFK